MPIDFPNTPTLGDDYTIGTTTWTYDGTKWVLKTYNSLHAVPVGAMLDWAPSSNIPNGWMLADGAAISRTQYADLFAEIGTTYGTGDGSTTFNLPNILGSPGSPVTLVKVTTGGAVEPSSISHATTHELNGSDVMLVDPLQIKAFTIDQKVAAYSLVFDDRNKMIEMNLSTSHNLTVPTNANEAFPIGSQVNVMQVGTGQTTIVGAGGVTVNATPGLKLRTQWSSCMLVKRGTNTWVAIGDLIA